MTKIDNSEDQFSIYKKYVPIFSAYSIGISGIFLWGFWSSFNVNIFQYIDISGIVKTALLPLLIAGSSLVVGALFGHYVRIAHNSPNEQGEFNNSNHVSFLRKHWRKISISWMLVTVFLLIFELDEKWEILPLFIGMPISIFLLGKGFALDVLPNSNFRSTVVVLLAILIPGSFTFELKEAEKIKSGKIFNYVVTEMDADVIIKSNDPEKKLRYISQVNEFSFFTIRQEKL